MTEGEISETSRMTLNEGQDGIPGTEEGIPPAEDTQHVTQGPPRDYTGKTGGDPDQPDQPNQTQSASQ
ncbi:hypothetical protein [Acidipropionibacterium jensenii]|uniref:Uncharacterized protein n=1 Tax=Acidipropionibacterium jensenii TaxID=1749 RepID=A0A448NZN4_9ACTN|nr:hypothetical protein [Acidipropionibacterium jensenii]MDN6557341.1 hypothetical protein [Acidipropionibacterium acidipropionici]MDN5978486.1 hypothetical protein [Acidipropionibacterium jensenii]MDN5997609.1 hypothetical protein [Acidipropionibacterium jensenii]MDN6425677.1 hypothetical protein [Acidipropionibacterium jensenii]MDN6514314.1 hypothetical protein [Acidipropionibacterium jensenii]